MPDDIAAAVPAYEGLVVADLSGTLSGAFAARLFADHGAHVTMLEPPEGHPLRREAPFFEDRPGPDRSVLHAYANWNKHARVVQDPAEAADHLATADLIVTTDPPDQLNRWPLDAIRPEAVHLSLTPHGLNGPLANVHAGNLIHNSRSGWAYINAYRDEPPLSLPSRQAGYVGGWAGFIAAAAALRRRFETGASELVDVRELEALSHTVFPWCIASIYEGSGWSRGATGGRQRGDPGPLWEAADGRMNFGFGDWHNWAQAMELLNLPDQGAREDMQQRNGRYARDLAPVQAGVARELPNLQKWPLFHQLAQLRCISGVFQPIDELLRNDQLAARGFVVKTELDGSPVRAAGDPHPMTPPSWSLRAPAPPHALPDSAADARAGEPRPQIEPDTRSSTRGPLDGIRILTFTHAWSGTFATELLAFLGADVVQIEALHHVDIWRNVRPWIPKAIRDESKVQHPVNTQGLFNAVNLNKRGITLDLRRDEGKQLFWRLLPKFDIVCENFRPGVLDGWGINLETLAAARPDIILATISGYGVTGPYARYPANGATTEPMSGLSSLHGYDGDPGMNTTGLYPDPISGYTLAGGIIAALARRDRVAGPQRIDVAMLEAVGVVVGDAMIEYDATARIPRPRGNHDYWRAPHNIYPCKGHDEWLAISIETDRQWHALARELGDENLIIDQRFATPRDRKSHERDLDQILAEWTCDQDAKKLEARLLSAGITAARVSPLYDLYAEPDPYLQKTGFVQSVDHPEAGPSWLPGAPWRLSGSADTQLRHSPVVGEHSREVLTTELDLTEAAYQALVARQITGTLNDLPLAAAD